MEAEVEVTNKKLAYRPNTPSTINTKYLSRPI